MRKSPDIQFNVGWPKAGEEGQGWLLLTPTPDDPGWDHSRPTLPFPVAIKLGHDEGGRLACIGLRLGSDAIPGDSPTESAPITSRTLHGLRIGAIVDYLAELRSYPRIEDTGYLQAVAAATAPDETSSRRPGRRGHSLAFYQGIADLYREALAKQPGSVYRYIVAHARDAGGRPYYDDTGGHRTARETVARKWVGHCRPASPENPKGLGLLGASRRGVAGEFNQSSEPRETP